MEKDMDFSQALVSLKLDFSVARRGWNGNGLLVKAQYPDDNSKMGNPYLYIDARALGGTLNPWVPSQTDLFGEDWYVVAEPVKTQKEELADRGVDHDKYDVLLEHNETIDDETTGIKVVRKSDGKAVEAVMNQSRRQLSEPGNTAYIDTIVELVQKLESE